MSSSFWRQEDVDRLYALNCHLIPTYDKLPTIKWRNDGTDYVMVKPYRDLVAEWGKKVKPKPTNGWAITMGGPGNLVCLDIERAGVTDTSEKGDRIREVMGLLPATCQRPSTNGGQHAYIHITDAPAPTGKGGKLVVVDGGTDPETGRRLTTLLAELRGHGQFAVILGLGRGELATDFAFHDMTLAEFTTLTDRLREVSDIIPTSRARKQRESRGRPASEKIPTRDWAALPPADVPDVLAKCMVGGSMSWLHVLDEGWEEVGATGEGWSLWQRPNYGSPSSHEASAHGAELLGTPSLTLWSAAVPWGESGGSYSPMGVLQISGRLGGEVTFPQAVGMVTTTARMVATDGARALAGTPFEDWPIEVFTEITEFVTDEAAGRPPLQMSNMADFQDQVVTSLGTGPTSGLFRRGDSLVHVPTIGEDGYIPSPDAGAVVIDGPAQVRTVKSERLSLIMDNYYWLFTRAPQKGGGYIDTHKSFPQAISQRLVSSPDLLPGLRPLRGVVHAPLLRADGSVLSTPGYDKDSGLLYLPDVPTPEVEEFPCRASLDTARGVAQSIISDFPFVSPDDRANYVMSMFLPMLRLVVPPPWPMWMLNAHERGSGKTLLSKVLRLTHSGVQRSAPPDNEEEIRKQLTTVLGTTTGTVVVFDNVMSTVRSAELAGMLTSAWRSDRKLGSSEDISAPNDRLWVCTGNNISIGGDMDRRTIWSTIDLGKPHPEMRPPGDFAIPHLETFLRENLGLVRWSLLTLLRQWVVEGMPVETERRSDDYGRLTSVAGGFLGSLGAPGTFNSPATQCIEVGGEDEEWGDFFAAIHRHTGETPFSTKTLLGWAAEPYRFEVAAGGVAEIHDAIPSELTARNSTITARSLGSFLAKRNGKFFRGYSCRVVGQVDGSKLFRISAPGLSEVS